VARSGTGVVRVAAIPLLIWLFLDRSNHPRRGLWPRLSPPYPRRGAGDWTFFKKCSGMDAAASS